MKKSLIALALATGFAAPVFAEDAAPAAAPAAAPEAGPHTFTGNMTIASDYRFRGISQTFGRPAIQGGVDYSHESGIYLGNWNSNVNEATGYPGGSIEMDFYGGWKKTWGDFGVDLGVLYYYYPGTDTGVFSPCNAKPSVNRCHNGGVDNTEVYVAGSWKFISFKWSHAVSDYFDLPKTDGTNYFDLSANYDLGNGWGVNGHVGYTDLKNFRSANGDDGKYTDWKVGVTKDFSGWVVGASYIGTDAKGRHLGDTYRYFNTNGKEIDAGRDTVVVSVSKTF